MISVHIPKGYNIKLAGKPSDEVSVLDPPDRVALLPEKIPFVKPRLRIDIGDTVSVGTPLFEDKRNPDLIFLSPGGGTVTRIDFGPRRVIREIVIALDQNETFEPFPVFSEGKIETVPRGELIGAIVNGGVWPLIRALPFRDIADPGVAPTAVIVSLDAEEPFQPLSEVYLKDNIDLFKFGIKILRRLSETVHISARSGNSAVRKMLNGCLTHTYQGRYPADDPGALLYRIKNSAGENRAWYIAGQDVLLLARLLGTGKFPIERTIAVGGPMASAKRHFLTRAGVPLNHIDQGQTGDNAGSRHIVGGVFRGYTGSRESFMGFYEKSLTLLPEGDEKEFFGFARPGFNKPSRSRAFLSYFNKSILPYDCNCHGEERACVNCGSCAEVCPVDILPQFAYKSIVADEIEEALAHGMLDCVECGLCTYVCPSKIELARVLKQTKTAYYLEQART